MVDSNVVIIDKETDEVVFKGEVLSDMSIEKTKVKTDFFKTELDVVIWDLHNTHEDDKGKTTKFYYTEDNEKSITLSNDTYELSLDKQQIINLAIQIYYNT